MSENRWFLGPVVGRLCFMTSAKTAFVNDEDRCFDALMSRDRRFDGQFIAGITSTGIYCRPSCPAPVRPLRKNVRFFPTAAAAQSAGLRSCKRCQPDASPGSPEWDLRGDLVGRAMRLIERGDVAAIGVPGVASALHISERHLHRILTEAVGAGPLALARAQRANLARILIETSDMPITDIAFAAGFSSIRQFNETVRAVYDRSPSELRKARRIRSAPSSHASTGEADGRDGADGADSSVQITLWLAARWPIDLNWMFAFHRGHGIPGVTSTGDLSDTNVRSYERTLVLTNGTGHVSLWAEEQTDPERPGVWASFSLDHISDLADAIATTRAMFDLDADPELIAERLAGDPHLAPFFAERPGVGVPGAADGFEAAVSAVIGQQISVAGARTLLGRLVDACSKDSQNARMTFPSAERLAEVDLDSLGLTTRRIRTIRALAAAVASGELIIDVGSDRSEVRRQLLDIPGIGPWTADVISMRALGDPDVLLESDLIIRRRLEELRVDDTSRWAPWRSYVACTLWATRDHTPDRRKTI